MNRAAIENLFSFTEYSWGAYEDAIRPLGDEFLVSPAPGSGWPALRDALVHINWAYVRWLTNPAATTAKQPEVVNNWEELNAYRRTVREHARSYLDSLDDDALVTKREMNVDGHTLVYSPADIFATVLLHERQHHGDLNTLLYQLGADIPVVEYRFSLAQPG